MFKRKPKIVIDANYTEADHGWGNTNWHHHPCKRCGTDGAPHKVYDPEKFYYPSAHRHQCLYCDRIDAGILPNKPPIFTKIDLDKDNRMLRFGVGKNNSKWFVRIDLWIVGFRLS